MSDIICHLRRLISLNEIKTRGSAHYLIIRLSMIKLPGTIQNTFEQIVDLPQSSTLMKILGKLSDGRCQPLIAIFAIFAGFKCFVIFPKFRTELRCLT